MTLINTLLCSLAFIIPVMCREVVVTDRGPVRGKLVDSYEARYYSYQGIPYAETPEGNLRFLPPVPKSPWNETLDATKVGSVCPQSEGRYRREQMSEDCLFVNVYVPASDSEDLLPVLMYVPGGEMQTLSGNDDFIYGPQFYMQRGVILVTCNYRLGALGFLSLDINEATGNAAIKDVLLALKWVNENIRHFGGDPKKLTLGGNSAGAILAHHLILTERSSDLFQRAILVSGSASGYRFLSRHAKQVALELAKELGIKTEDQYETLRKLKDIDAFDIVKATQKLGEKDVRKGFRPFAPFVPCVEIETSHAIITKDPIEIIKEGIPQNVPILVGFNAKEGIKMLFLVQKDPTLLEKLNENFELCIPTDIEYPYGSEKSRNLAKSIRQFYLDNAHITNDTLEGFIDLITATQFSYSIDTWIKLHKKQENSNTLFYYLFNYDGGLNWFKMLNNGDYPGAAHTDDAGYTFVTNATKSRLQHLENRDKTMIDIMMTYWTNFVKFGSPSPNSNTFYTKWEETTEERNYLLLNDNPQSISSAPTPTNIQFWTDVYEEYYDYLKNGGPIEAKIIP